jgi:hypothetical protein
MDFTLNQVCSKGKAVAFHAIQWPLVCASPPVLPPDKKEIPFVTDRFFFQQGIDRRMYKAVMGYGSDAWERPWPERSRGHVTIRAVTEDGELLWSRERASV